MSEEGSLSPLREELVLKHGLLLHKTYKVSSKINSLIYNSEKESVVVLLRGAIAEYQHGRQTLLIEKGINYNRLLYASEQNKYVGISERTLHLLHNDLTTVLHEITSELPISCCIYNPLNDTVITAGFENITIWRFYSGGRSLISDGVITGGLEEKEVSLLHVEEVPGNAQRLFAVVGNRIKVYKLASHQLLSEGTSLHSRPISAVLFFRPLTYLITGARDGSIKVWNQFWDLQYTFIGHQSPVSAISPYPTGPCIVTGSLDNSLRLWNLVYWDEVQKVDHQLPAHGVHSQPGHQRVVSYSSRQIRIWTVSEIYRRMTVTGSPCTGISSASHPSTPLRLVGAFADSTVRIISPVSGTIITTALLPLSLTVIGTAYMPFHEWLFVLTSDGLLTKYNSRVHPCQQLTQWTLTQGDGAFSCVALYQLILDQEEMQELLSHDKWLSVAVEAHKVKRGMEDPLKREKEGEHLLIAGTDRGAVCVLDKESGEVQCSVKNHAGPVTSIIAHPKRDQLLSTSKDSTIVVWRVYAYTTENLVMMMSFNVAGVPTHLSVLFDRVCVCINNMDRASYTSTVYSMRDKVTYNSDPLSNHTEPITGLDVSTSLHLFATSSHDCSIRIWSEDNTILRILQLDAPPTAIVFSSAFGTLTISLRHHLHSIPHSTHLTENYIKQLVSLGLREEDMESQQGEEPRVLSQELGEYLLDDQARLYPMDDHFEADSYRGALSEEELNHLDRLTEAKKKGVELVLEREKELRDIRDGIVTAKKKDSKGLMGAMKSKAWKEVFPLLRPLPPLDVDIPLVDDFDPDTYGLNVETPIPYEPYQAGERHAFFPPLSKFDPPYPIAPDGFLPNSAILQKLRKSEEDRLLAQQWCPPTLSDRQRRLIEETNKVEEEEEETVDGDSDLMERLKAAMEAQESPEQSLTPTPPPTPPPEPPKRELKSQMKVEKIIAPKPKPKPPPKPRTPTPPPPPRSPTPPPPPPTPLPEYITQFIGQPWFESLYPNANSKTFPRPWSVTRFVYALLSCLGRSVNCLTKAEICKALYKLIKEYSPSNAAEVGVTVLQLLMGPPSLSSQHMSERHLVKSGLNLLFHLDKLDNSLTTLLMGYYSESNPEIQDMVLDYFQSKGVSDPHKYFPRELDSNFASSSSQLSELVVKSSVWLESWSKEYLKSKGVKIPREPATNQKRSTLRSTKSQPMMKLPHCEPVEVINHFVKIEHEKELARRRPPTPPPPPPEIEEDVPHNVVVPLPQLEHTHGCLIRLGDTHCSKCHPDRETSLAQINHILRAQRQADRSLKAINLSLKTQNVNPFLSEEEQREMELFEQSRKQLVSNTRLFLLEQSYPQL